MTNQVQTQIWVSVFDNILWHEAIDPYLKKFAFSIR